MTQVVTVHTDFTDLNQMAQGLVGRVNETHVILPGPEPVEVGEWVQFAVTLYDGTPGFAGVGRCVTVVDNGEERLSHQRFDVVIDSLQFDSRGQQIFEHILTLNGLGGAEGEGAYDEQVNGAEQTYAEAGDYAEEQAYDAPAAAFEEPEHTGSFEDVSEHFSASKLDLAVESVAVEQDEDSEATMIGEAGSFAEALSTDAEDDDSGPTVPPPMAEATPDLGFPANGSSVGQATTPPPAPVAARQHVNGVKFKYERGLPFPAVPPRPEITPEKRVSPAPRPRA